MIISDGSEIAVIVGGFGFVGGAIVYAGAGVARELERRRELIAATVAKFDSSPDRIANALSYISANLKPGARVAEIQLERMDRARPAIEPGALDASAIGMTPPRPAPAVPPGPGGRPPVLPVCQPVEAADVECPSCKGETWGKSTCRLCFGSQVTSAGAAKDFVAARELAGAF